MEQTIVAAGIGTGGNKAEVAQAFAPADLNEQLADYFAGSNLPALVAKINAAAEVLERQGIENGLAEAATYVCYNTALAMAVVLLRSTLSSREASIQIKEYHVELLLERLLLKMQQKFPEKFPKPDKPE